MISPLACLPGSSKYQSVPILLNHHGIDPIYVIWKLFFLLWLSPSLRDCKVPENKSLAISYLHSPKLHQLTYAFTQKNMLWNNTLIWFHLSFSFPSVPQNCSTSVKCSYWVPLSLSLPCFSNREKYTKITDKNNFLSISVNLMVLLQNLLAHFSVSNSPI